MNEPTYRLLNPGEVIEGTDQYYQSASGQWMSLTGFADIGRKAGESGVIFRRLIPEPKWISVKEKPPEFPCWGFDGQCVFHSACHGPGAGTITHWMPAPLRPEPPQASEQEQDERALQQCWQRIKLLDATGKQLIEETWRTCLAYERARKK